MNILIILNFNGEFYNFFHICNQKLQKYFIAYVYYWVKL